MGTNSDSPVTVLGLGPMGSALAMAFTGNGHPTTVWNRTSAKAAPLVAKGAARADTPAEAVVASPLVIVCVIDYGAAHAIIDSLTAELRGKTLVNLTADSPDRARETARWAVRHGIDYLDGSIMTPTVTIGRPEAVFLYSGPEEVYERYRPALASLGGTVTRVGTEPGRAAAFDVALLDAFWTAMSGIAHAFALARAENIPATELAPFAQGIIDLAGQLTTELAADVDAGHYPGEDSTLASNAASLAHIIHAARVRGIDTGVLEAVKGTADQSIAAGHGQDGFSRMVDAFAAPAT